MGGYLIEKNDLGIDSEILVASVVELVKAGVATGPLQDASTGVATGSFIVPGADFEFCADNPSIELHRHRVGATTCRASPAIQNLVAINQASMIDLTGQVASESIGPGDVHRTRRAARVDDGRAVLPGGRAIHVLPSTARNGTVSRIVAQRYRGTIVTVPRTFVDFVDHRARHRQPPRPDPTRARTGPDRARHPNFRDQLRAEARRLFWA